ncbi:MAG: HDOD domain-containing protein [Campylobacterota bacterium]|nr:HDOD domain-containing protein [Campylobacterota bacterium]
MGFESIIEKVHSLPPLPESIQKLQLLFAEGAPDTKALVAVIEVDPILTADILAKVNAPLYALRNNIVSVAQAITLFGINTIRGFAFNSSVNRSFDIDMSPYNISNAQFSDLCNMQSSLMFQWYMGVDVELASSLIPIAFLMETGRVVVAEELMQSDYMNYFQEELKTCDSIEEVERLYAGVTTAEVNVMLFEHWNFDEVFIETMRYLDSKEEVPQQYRMPVEALRVIRQCINVKTGMTEASIEEATKMVAAYGLDTERFKHAAYRVLRKYEEQE